ncbi:MAG TPA: hypothetical protein VKB05_01705 [Pyrinomonadaceae bacterium]|nr:hypothetical protein [Pyrinomonadaceae bacterium]
MLRIAYCNFTSKQRGKSDVTKRLQGVSKNAAPDALPQNVNANEGELPPWATPGARARSNENQLTAGENCRIIESLGKYTYLITSPGSYNTSPKTKLTIFNLGNKRLYSLFGSVASSRLTAGTPSALPFKAISQTAVMHTCDKSTRAIPSLSGNTHML